MSMIFEISTFKLAKISSKILDTKKKNFFVELRYRGQCLIKPIMLYIKLKDFYFSEEFCRTALLGQGTLYIAEII